MGNRYPINIKSTKKFCFDTDSPCQESVYGVSKRRQHILPTPPHKSKFKYYKKIMTINNIGITKYKILHNTKMGIPKTTNQPRAALCPRRPFFIKESHRRTSEVRREKGVARALPCFVFLRAFFVKRQRMRKTPHKLTCFLL